MRARTSNLIDGFEPGVRRPARYEPSEVPSSPDNRSRFLLDSGPLGSDTHSPVQNAIANYSTLWSEMQAKLPATPVEFVTVEIYKVVLAADLTHRLDLYRTIRQARVYQNQRPGKFSKRVDDSGQILAAGGASLDTFFKGTAGWKGLQDEEIWLDLLAFCVQENITNQRTLTDLSLLVGQAIAGRAGIHVKAEFL